MTQIPADVIYAIVCLIIYLPVSFFVTRSTLRDKVEDTFEGNIFSSFIISALITIGWPLILIFGLAILPHYLTGKFYDR